MAFPLLYARHARGTKDTKVTKDTKGLSGMRPNEVSYKVIGAAIKVHSALGAGILESAYDSCLCYELAQTGLHFHHQVRLPVNYRGNRLSPAYRIDFIVEQCVVVEIKCVEKLLPVHKAQLLSYLRLTGITLGLLLNFNVAHLRDGIKRIINGPESEL
jgi:GxxExxY protein